MMTMDTKSHWQNVYKTKATDQVSWYRPHLETSLALVERACTGLTSSIIDVGGGESTLVDDLLARGYLNLTVLDIAETALKKTQGRLGKAAEKVHWLAADVTCATLQARSYDVWHDRAVFHFLTTPEQRRAYVEMAAFATKPGGHVIVGAFGPEGPTRCSGLDALRYDADSLHGEFGVRFRLVDSLKELHVTPFGNTQQFLYCYYLVE